MTDDLGSGDYRPGDGELPPNSEEDSPAAAAPGLPPIDNAADVRKWEDLGRITLDLREWLQARTATEWDVLVLRVAVLEIQDGHSQVIKRYAEAVNAELAKMPGYVEAMAEQARVAVRDELAKAGLKS